MRLPARLPGALAAGVGAGGGFILGGLVDAQLVGGSGFWGGLLGALIGSRVLSYLVARWRRPPPRL